MISTVLRKRRKTSLETAEEAIAIGRATIQEDPEREGEFFFTLDEDESEITYVSDWHAKLALGDRLQDQAVG